MHFFNHPIISSIVLKHGINKHDLHRQSGIQNKREFLSQIQELIDDKHMRVDFEEYCPKTLSILVASPDEGIYVDKIEIEYVPSSSLEKLMGFETKEEIKEVEDDFDFHLLISPIQIEEKHLSFLNPINKAEFDFEKYNYFLSAEYISLTEIQNAIDGLTSTTIIHLDDHSLYASGLKKGVGDKYFPNCNWKHYTHPDEALVHIQGKFAAGELINLIITDINHPGINGYEFAKAIRQLEAEYHIFRTPLLAVTMCSEDHPFVHLGLVENLFDKYLPKSTESEIIGGYMTSLVLPPSFKALN